MAKPSVSAAGGWPAMFYVFKKAHEAGGFLKLYKRLRSRNACKTCAVGMGGQAGGMVNEAGHFPEVCKKSIQAQVGDMQAPISAAYFAQIPIALMERLTSAQCENLGRLAFPIMAGPGDTHFRPVGWDEALAHAGQALRDAGPKQTYFYSSGRSSNEAAFLMQLVARAFGCANIHNCSYYCHQASGVALNRVYGSTTSAVSLDDLARTDLAMVVGANPASNHPRLVTQLMHLRRRGGKVVVINPLREMGLTRFRVPSDWRSMLFGTSIANVYLQPHIGGDVALLTALLKGLYEARRIDRAFVDAYTVGWDAVEEHLRGCGWDTLVQDSGVSRADIERTVELLIGAERGIFMWAMGLTHHTHGVDNITALCNLALARGFLGKPGSGLLPIRGHSNVQGVGSVGVAPYLKASFRQRLEEIYGITVPDEPGQDTYASMVAAHAGDIRASVWLGGNLYGSNPTQVWAAEALRKVDFTLSLTTKLNEGHLHGRGKTMVILPVLARDEEHQATTQESMFNYVRLSAGGPPAVAGSMRSEVEILAALAEHILPKGRFDWASLRSHEHLRQAMAQIVPGYGEVGSLGTHKAEFHLPNRLVHTPRFFTPDGKAHFYPTPLPKLAREPGTFRLMTIRSEGQFNTVVYEEHDLYRGNTRRDVVMMAASDATLLGLAEGSRVRVQSAVGELEVSVAIVEIRAGNLAMYYPEANVLVPADLDPMSKTPAFKNVTVRLRPVVRSPLALLAGAA